MTPLDFMEFRNYLSPASGFQSVQFRLIENKLGVKNELRTNYGKSHYLKIFEDPKVIEQIKKSEQEPSLCDLLQLWLERTPGLEVDEFNFWEKYKKVVTSLLEQNRVAAEGEDDPLQKTLLIEECKRKSELFDSIFDVNKHNALMARGDRRFSHRALQGALMISLYRDEPRFNQPFHILVLLMDIDSLITKWRCKSSISQLNQLMLTYLLVIYLLSFRLTLHLIIQLFLRIANLLMVNLVIVKAVDSYRHI